MIKNLILTAGGINGMAHIGALKYIEELNLLKNITCYIGVSVGSLISILIIVGYKISEIEQFILDFDFIELKNININLFFSKFGIDNGIKFEKTIKLLIKNKLNKPNITLLELYNLTKINLVIVTCCLNKIKSIYLNYKTHPNLEIFKAVRMSISIPFYFTPVEYNDNLYIDGALLNNIPLEYLDKKSIKETLVFLLEHDIISYKIISIDQYFLGIIQALNVKINLNDIKGYENRIVKILIGNHSCIEFDIKKEHKKKIIEKGYTATYNYFKKNL